MSGTASDNEWQRVATNDNDWTTSGNEWYNEWQRETTSSNEWQTFIILANFLFFEKERNLTAKHSK